MRPGQLNLMTAGHGVSHSEFSLGSQPLLHAVQLWVALPGRGRRRPGRVRAGQRPAGVGDRAGAGDGVRRRPRRVPVPRARAHPAARRRDRRSTPHADVEVPLGPRLRARRPAARRLRAGRRDAAHVAAALLYLGDGRDLVRVELARRRPAAAARRRTRSRTTWSCGGTSSAAPTPTSRRRAPPGSPTSAPSASASVAGHDGARIPAPDLPNVRLQPRRRRPRTSRSSRDRPDAPARPVPGGRRGARPTRASAGQVVALPDSAADRSRGRRRARRRGRRHRQQPRLLGGRPPAAGPDQRAAPRGHRRRSRGRLGRTHIGRATPEQVRAATGQAIGGVAPVGPPRSRWRRSSTSRWPTTRRSGRRAARRTRCSRRRSTSSSGSPAATALVVGDERVESAGHCADWARREGTTW